MKRLWLLCWPLFAVACSETPEGPVTPALMAEPSAHEKGLDPVTVGRRLIEEREQDDNLHKAIRLLHWHATQKPQSVDLQILAAEACSLALELLDPKKADDKASHRLLRQLGRPHADEAVRLAPGNGAAHYWRGCMLLHEADAEQSLGKTNEALRDLEKAESLQPSVDDGGPSRMKGRVLAEMPFLFGGSLSKAVAAYRKSLEIAPDRITTHLWLGEAYLEAKKPELARKELDWVVAAKARPGHEKEDGKDQREAAEKLKTLK
jgi:tetratricopeptide (TPR) repeat protein